MISQLLSFEIKPISQLDCSVNGYGYISFFIESTQKGKIHHDVFIDGEKQYSEIINELFLFIIDLGFSVRHKSNYKIGFESKDEVQSIGFEVEIESFGRGTGIHLATS